MDILDVLRWPELLCFSPPDYLRRLDRAVERYGRAALLGLVR